VTDSAVDSGTEASGEAMDNLGPRLRDVRMRSGMSLREVARQLGVSPSFISQMENGKSQPSVATLYSIAQLLEVSIDELFDRGNGPIFPEGPEPAILVDPLHAAAPVRAVTSPDLDGTVNRSDFTSPADVWPTARTSERLKVLSITDRPRLAMDSGVIWEQLASNSDRDLDFMEITYPPGASSTNDGRMLRHQGMEYGYLLSGTLQITHGFETHVLEPGQSMSLDPSVPHLLTNPGSVPARGIWVVHHCAHGTSE